MARTVRDAALMLSAIAGPDPRSPLAIAEPGIRFAAPLERDFRGVRIAWSRDLGGLPVDARVTATIDSQRRVFESLGCLIQDAEPDFADADQVFKVLRAWTFSLAFGQAGEDVLKQLKETVVWNIEQGRGLSAAQVGDAEIRRTRLYHRVREFMLDHEFLILPVNQVPPFDVKQRYVTEIAGQKMQSYIDWMKSCYYITVTGHPAISVPCGFTPEGLPVGVQIVGRHQDDFGVLQLAHAFEEATGFWKRRPSLTAAAPPRAPLEGGPG
jgi:amidase